MDQLAELQRWYQAQCNGKWEQTYGVAVGTLDNPGWSLSVDLTGTALKQTPFATQRRGVDDDDDPQGDDWYVCRVEAAVFTAFGGPEHLTTILSIFLKWATEPR
jgi:hypothetical protein